MSEVKVWEGLKPDTTCWMQTHSHPAKVRIQQYKLRRMCMTLRDIVLKLIEGNEVPVSDYEDQSFSRMIFLDEYTELESQRPVLGDDSAKEDIVVYENSLNCCANRIKMFAEKHFYFDPPKGSKELPLYWKGLDCGEVRLQQGRLRYCVSMGGKGLLQMDSTPFDSSWPKEKQRERLDALLKRNGDLLWEPPTWEEHCDDSERDT